MPPMAERGLPVQARPTRKVAAIEGTSTLARKIIVATMLITPIRYIQCAAVRVTLASIDLIRCVCVRPGGSGGLGWARIPVHGAPVWSVEAVSAAAFLRLLP